MCVRDLGARSSILSLMGLGKLLNNNNRNVKSEHVTLLNGYNLTSMHNTSNYVLHTGFNMCYTQRWV